MPDKPYAALLRFIESNIEGARGPFEVMRFAAGYSNITLHVRCAQVELVVRQAPPGVVVKGAHDIEREYHFMRKLALHWPRVPRVLALCMDEDVAGSRFLVMEFVPGRSIDVRQPPDPDVVSRACCQLVLALADLHAIDPLAAALTTKVVDQEFASRQVVNAIKRYRAAELRSIPALEAVMRWLQANSITTQRLAVTHNDYRFDNAIFAPNASLSVRAVLDWEMATVGDPWMDLGTALAYWTEAGDSDTLKRHALGPTLLPGALTRDEVCALYVQAAGFETPHMTWYSVLGLLRLIVILQQLEARSVRGLSDDARFTGMSQWIDALSVRAAQTIEKDAR